MFQHWLIITLSWVNSVSLQYIKSGGPDADLGLDAIDGPPDPEHYIPTSTDYDSLQKDPLTDQFYQRDDVLPELLRRRRTSNALSEARPRRYTNIYTEKDSKHQYPQNNNILVSYKGSLEENGTANEILDPLDKKYFSPWGGKRDKVGMEHMWTWKRANGIREPSMPKRVRFSPWGGKRSGQMIYIPGLQLVPNLEKRSPIKIYALSSSASERKLRDAMPFKSFLDAMPKLFKPGHPYADVNLKKDGKRKVKFSAWGGKRSPPIIGPIWTPASQDLRDSPLETIILLKMNEFRNEQNQAS